LSDFEVFLSDFEVKMISISASIDENICPQGSQFFQQLEQSTKKSTGWSRECKAHKLAKRAQVGKAHKLAKSTSWQRAPVYNESTSGTTRAPVYKESTSVQREHQGAPVYKESTKRAPVYKREHQWIQREHQCTTRAPVVQREHQWYKESTSGTKRAPVDTKRAPVVQREHQWGTTRAPVHKVDNESTKLTKRAQS
jgi:hypothetical protein